MSSASEIRPPTLLVHRPCAPSWGWTETPTLHAGLVLLAGAGTGQGGPVTVLQALDAASGEERFALAIETDAPGREVVMSLVHVSSPDTLLVAVYRQDEALEVMRVGLDGRVLARDDLGAEGSLCGWDVSCKVMLAAAGERDGAYLVSYLYRQVREYKTFARAFGEPRVRWESDEWLLAADDRVVVGATRPERPPRPAPATRGRFESMPAELVCRARTDGAVLWRCPAPPGHVDVAGLHDGRVVLVDRRLRFQEQHERERSLDESFLAGRVDDATYGAELDRIWQSAPARAPTIVTALDARDGRACFAHELAGDVLDVRAGCAGGLAVLRASATEAELLRLDEGGGVTEQVAIPPPAPARAGWPPHDPTHRILDAGEGFVLWADHGNLHMSARDGAWSFPLPDACAGFRPRVLDRSLPQMSAAILDGTLALRSNERLWILGV
jgi:hypothetical protein